MIEDLIESLENDEDVILMHPVNSQSLSAAQSFLMKSEMPKLPDDYVDFLHITNGLVYRGVIFYGTSAVEEEKMPDMVSANQEFMENYESRDLVVIGNDRHTLFVYNRETDMYEIVDKEDLDLIDEFEEFIDLISEFFEGDNGSMREDDDDYMFEDDYED